LGHQEMSRKKGPLSIGAPPTSRKKIPLGGIDLGVLDDLAMSTSTGGEAKENNKRHERQHTHLYPKKRSPTHKLSMCWKKHILGPLLNEGCFGVESSGGKKGGEFPLKRRLQVAAQCNYEVSIRKGETADNEKRGTRSRRGR